MAQTTITIQERTLERFNEKKRELAEMQDLPEQSADMFLQSLLDTWDAANDGYYSPEVDAIVEQLLEQLDSNCSGGDSDISEITEKLESIHKDIDQLPQQNAEALQQYM